MHMAQSYPQITQIETDEQSKNINPQITPVKPAALISGEMFNGACADYTDKKYKFIKRYGMGKGDALRNTG
jgi:hypothetical protein